MISIRKKLRALESRWLGGDSLAKNTIIYTVGIVLNKAIGFFLIPIYTRYFSVEEYGTLSLLTVVSQLSQFVFLLGISSSAMRFYFDYQDEDSRKKVYGTALILLMTVPIVLFALFTPLMRHFWPRLIRSIPFHPLVFIVLLTSLFSPLGILLAGLLRIQKRAIASIAYSFASFIVLAGASIYAVVFLRKGVAGQIYAQLFVQVLFCVIAFLLLLPNSSLKFSWPMARSLLRYGLPLLPFFLFTWLDNASLRILLEKYVGLKSVGIFSLASQFVGIMVIFGTAMDYSFLPHFFETAVQPDAADRLGNFALKYFALLGTIILAVALFSKPIIQWIAAPRFHEAIRYVPIMLVGSLLVFLFRIFNWSLMFSKKTGMLSALTGASVLLLIVLLILFLREWRMGIWGAAAAAIAVGCCRLIAGYLVSRRFFCIAFRWGRTVQLAVVFLVTMAIIEFLHVERSVMMEMGIKTTFLVAAAGFFYRIAKNAGHSSSQATG